jgi:hypothetical protein
MNYLDEFEFELNEAKNICHVYTDKLRYNPNEPKNSLLSLIHLQGLQSIFQLFLLQL